MQVKLNLLARTLTGAEAGHIRSIAYGPGQTGRIVGFVRRAAAGDPTEKLDLAVVRWDAQVWREAVVPLDGSPREITDELGAPVTLPAFEALANLVHLTPVRENELTSRGGDRVDTSQYAAMAQLMPSRVGCGRATNPVAGQYLIVVRPFTSGVSVVDDYAHRPGVKLRRVGPRTGSFTADVAPAAFEILQRDLRVAEIWDLCR